MVFDPGLNGLRRLALAARREEAPFRDQPSIQSPPPLLDQVNRLINRPALAQTLGDNPFAGQELLSQQNQFTLNRGDRPPLLQDVRIRNGPATGPGYKAEPGPFPVAVADDIALQDASRGGRTVSTKVFYPQGADPTQPLPVIVFSPGLGASNDSYDYFGQQLASQGYAVVVPTHPGTDAAAAQQLGIQELSERFKTDLSLTTDRAKDISFVLDSLGTLDQQVPVSLDASRIGVAGHSAGASTALLVGGATIDLPGAPNTSLADPRVKAILPISPQGAGIRGLDPQSFETIGVPYFAISGTRDFAEAKPLERLDGIRNVPPGNNQYHLLLRGARHLDFADRNNNTAVQQLTTSGAAAFFDATLQGNPQAQRYLTTGGLDRFGGPDSIVLTPR